MKSYYPNNKNVYKCKNIFYMDASTKTDKAKKKKNW